MHRLFKPVMSPWVKARQVIQPPLKQRLIFSALYSTTEHPLIAKYRQTQPAQLWNTYEEIKQDPTVFDHLQREDFAKLRANLWKQATWATEDRILQVLEDMKPLHAWTILEYNEYFMAKLFQAQYDDILRMYSDFQQLQPAISLSIGAFNVILATYIQLGQIDEAIVLIKEAKSKHDVIPNIRDFDRTMYRCLPKNKQVCETAKRLITQHGFSSIAVLNTNLLHLFERKRLPDIKWIYEQKQDDVLDVTTYNILIKGFSDNRLTRDAIQVYHDMVQKKVRPNAYICATVLSIYAHTRDVESAENLVRSAIQSGIQPDESIYNQLIKVYFKGRETYKAFQIFSEIQKNPKLKMNGVILNTMIDGLMINKDVNMASILYKDMLGSEFKPDMITCNTMLKGYMKVGDITSAIGIISDMEKLGMEPDTVTFTTLIDSVFQKNQPETAENMMKVIKQMGVQPNTYTFNAIINGWIKTNKMEEAEKTMEIMKSPEYQLRPTIHTYTNLIQGYVEQMNLRKAMETFQILLRNGIQPDRATFNFMIVGFLNHDRLNDAYVCLEKMISMKLSPTKDTWMLLLEECCHRKDWIIGQKVVRTLDHSGFVITSDSLKRSYTIVKSHCK